MNSLNLPLTKLTPSLAPLVTSKFSKKLEGKRVKANVKLLYKGQIVKEEIGEVLFKKDGISGIVIFNMTSYLSRLHLSSYKDYQISLDMLKNLSYDELKKYKLIDRSLKNVLQMDIAEEIIKNNLDPKNYILDIKDIYDFKNSQVTSGGIDLSVINNDLSLKCDKNIFVGGEFIDIDGECGGYNIEFALLSGIRIGTNL